jgi:hypothetical protein
MFFVNFFFPGRQALRIRPRGQIFEKPNCRRFAPTKAVKVNQSQYLLMKRGLASTPRARLDSMKKPAIAWIQSVTIMMFPFLLFHAVSEFF